MENNDDLDSGKPAFLNEQWYKDIQRQSKKETQAVAEAVALLQKTFDIRNVRFGHEGDEFQKNESTLILKLKSRYDQG